ncbi:MAG: nucleoside deaminase [Alteromonadaceae bacterium]|nr:nucleoside deaminase [Alteromonadaceae bacterium]
MSVISTQPVLSESTPINDNTLNMVARIPTKQLLHVFEEGFFTKLQDKDLMRLAVLLAQKGYEEGGCAIGGVVRSNKTGLILGKGHNKHIQESRLYWHGETDAYNDAYNNGNPDFSEATAYTTLTPCSVCTALTFSHSFSRIVIGNRLGGVNQENEDLLRDKGVQVDILEDPLGVALYAQYAQEKPEQDTRDWQGQAGVVRAGLQGNDCGSC